MAVQGNDRLVELAGFNAHQDCLVAGSVQKPSTPVVFGSMIGSPPAHSDTVITTLVNLERALNSFGMQTQCTHIISRPPTIPDCMSSPMERSSALCLSLSVCLSVCLSPDLFEGAFRIGLRSRRIIAVIVNNACLYSTLLRGFEWVVHSIYYET